MPDNDHVVGHRQLGDHGFECRDIRLTVAGQLLTQLFPPGQRAALAFHRLRHALNAAARGDGLRQLVPADVAIAESPRDKSSQILRAAVCFA